MIAQIDSKIDTTIIDGEDAYVDNYSDKWNQLTHTTFNTGKTTWDIKLDIPFKRFVHYKWDKPRPFFLSRWIMRGLRFDKQIETESYVTENPFATLKYTKTLVVPDR